MPQNIPHAPRALSRKQFLVVLISFLGLLGGLFSWIIWILTPKLHHFQNKEIFYICEEVVSGEELLMRPIKGKGEERQPIRVRVRGIEAPPLEEGPAAEAFAQRLGVPADQVPEMGKISRNTLAVWLYRQSNIMMKFDRESPEFDDAGRLIAHVELSLVDVGKMQLIEGQALIRDESNDYAELYQKYTRQAEANRYGIWRLTAK